MGSITEKDIAAYRCILLYDDETIADAAAALRDAGGYEWWHAVIELSDGGYAAAPFSDLTALVEAEKVVALTRPLAEVIGAALKRVDVTAELGRDDLEAVKKRAEDTASGVAVVLKDGEFKGIIAAGGTRGGAARGIMDTGLVGLAGQYAALPTKGLMSKRRRQAEEARKKKGTQPAA